MPWKEKQIGIKLIGAGSLVLGTERVKKNQVITEESHPRIFAKYQTSDVYQRKFAPVLERYFEPGPPKREPKDDKSADRPKKGTRRKKSRGGE